MLSQCPMSGWNTSHRGRGSSCPSVTSKSQRACATPSLPEPCYSRSCVHTSPSVRRRLRRFVFDEFLTLEPFDHERRYLLFLLLTDGFISLVDSSTYGAKMPRANWGFIGNIQLPTPPLVERQAIAAFLDDETAKIDSLVTKKHLLLDRLAEYRTALITRTVTKGLPPEAAKQAGLIPELAAQTVRSGMDRRSAGALGDKAAQPLGEQVGHQGRA